jgi:hypothetical protein
MIGVLDLKMPQNVHEYIKINTEKHSGCQCFYSIQRGSPLCSKSATKTWCLLVVVNETPQKVSGKCFSTETPCQYCRITRM